MPRLVWAAWIAVGIAIEARALQRQRAQVQPRWVDTLSAFFRWLFHTDTRAGRLTFVAFWGGLSAWFVPHIIRAVAALDEAHTREEAS